MTVSNPQIRVSYVGDGTSTAFPIPFPFYDDTDIVVFLGTAPQSAGYSISGGEDANGNPQPGTLTFSTPPVAQVAVQAILDVPLTQLVNLVDGTAFPSSTINQVNDRSIQAALRLADRLSRTILAPDGDVAPGMALPAAGIRANTFLGFDVNGNVLLGQTLPSGTLSQSTIGLFLYPRTAAEIAAGVTPVNYAYAPGDVRRQGMVDDGATDWTSAFQKVLNAAAGNVPVVIPRIQGSGYLLSGRITAPANTTIIFQDGAQLRWTATTATGTSFQGNATRPGIEVIGNNFVLQGRGQLTGPSVGAYVGDESAIMGFGASRTSPYVGFTVDGQIEFNNWGWGACFIQFFTNVQWNSTYVHNVGYIGIGFVSCVNITCHRNRVDTVTPGTGSNAYGITFTHDSTNYSSDPNAATNGRIAANPFCISGDCAFNTVMNIPIWEGIDAHGGYELKFHHNNVYNCDIGIALAGGSGAAAGYAGEDNEVSFNNVYLNQIDGTATTVVAASKLGIELKGGVTVLHRKVRCIGNVIDGYGDEVTPSYSIEATNCVPVVVTGNTCLNWAGYGFYAANAEGVIADNTFQGVSNATGSTCVFLDTTTGTWVVKGNRHHPISGTASAGGLRINNTNNPRCLIQGNDFFSATTPFQGFADGDHTLGDSYPVPRLTVTGTPTSFDLTPLGNAPLVDVLLNVSGNSTVSTINGPTIGGVVRIRQSAGFTTTFDRTHAALQGSANQAVAQNQVLLLMCTTASGGPPTVGTFIGMGGVTTNG